IPTTISPSTPNPAPRTTTPASQPARPPTINQTIISVNIQSPFSLSDQTSFSAEIWRCLTLLHLSTSLIIGNAHQMPIIGLGKEEQPKRNDADPRCTALVCTGSYVGKQCAIIGQQGVAVLFFEGEEP